MCKTALGLWFDLLIYSPFVFCYFNKQLQAALLLRICSASQFKLNLETPSRVQRHIALSEITTAYAQRRRVVNTGAHAERGNSPANGTTTFRVLIDAPARRGNAFSPGDEGGNRRATSMRLNAADDRRHHGQIFLPSINLKRYSLGNRHHLSWEQTSEVFILLVLFSRLCSILNQ